MKKVLGILFLMSAAAFARDLTLDEAIEPFSYTHLDVYKIQDMLFYKIPVKFKIKFLLRYLQTKWFVHFL